MDWQIPGALLIWFALAGNLVAGAAFAAAGLGRASYEQLGRRAYTIFTLAIVAASVWLYVLFFNHQYQFKYIWEYSERSQDFLYVVSAFWGGQEGTYLLWTLFNALFGYLILKKGGLYRHWAMTVLAVVNLFFLALLIRLSPFAYGDTSATDGAGLNPLLRDPWMVIHPPVMFLGYAAACLPFAIAMAALIKNDYSRWNKIAFPWVALTAVMLGAGNILGGFWAYKTLGWGGFWGWDPVENSSLVPWVISLALMHGMIIERRSSGLRKANILMAAFLFLLVIYGTFLTRSGVLSDFSVHSFADLGINGLLIGFLLFFVVASALLFAWRARQIESSPISYGFYGREFLLFSGLVTLLLFGLIVLFWMSLPILTTAFSDTPRAADVATYNAFAQPMSVLIALLLIISPFTNFAEVRVRGFGKKAIGIAGLGVAAGIAIGLVTNYEQNVTGVTGALVVTALGLVLIRTSWLKSFLPAFMGGVIALAISILSGVREPLHLMFFSLATVALVTNLQSVIKHFSAGWRQIGGHLTHFGFATMIIGVLASSAFSVNDKVVLSRGEGKPARSLTIIYNGLAHDMKTPNNEVRLSIISGADTTAGAPQLYVSERMGGTMRKPYIRRRLLEDIYFSPEDIQQPRIEPLILKKGEKQTVGGTDLVFTGFDMGQHGDAANSLTVTAKLTASSYGSTAEIRPAVIHDQAPDGTPKKTSLPDSTRIGGAMRKVELVSILADQGAVSVNIPGITDQSRPESLVLDVSSKPLINLVWAGAILIILGTGISVVRRQREMAQAEPLHVAQTSPAATSA